MPIEKIITKKNFDKIIFDEQPIYTIYCTTENNEEDYWKYNPCYMNNLQNNINIENFDILYWNIGEKKIYEILLINNDLNNVKDKIITCKLRDSKTKEKVYEVNFEIPYLEAQTILKGISTKFEKNYGVNIFIKKIN